MLGRMRSFISRIHGKCTLGPASFKGLDPRAFVLILYLLHDYYFEKLFDLLFTGLEVDSDIIYKDAVFLLK